MSDDKWKDEQDDTTYHTVSETALRALVRDVSKAAYRSAKYRGQFNSEEIDPLGEKVVTRKADDWLDQNKDEYL